MAYRNTVVKIEKLANLANAGDDGKRVWHRREEPLLWTAHLYVSLRLETRAVYEDSS
jgi:hypothetical protein